MKNTDVLKITLGGFGILILLASILYAIPQTINYQGLLEEDGIPVDGSRDVTFRIYDSSESGSILWEEEQSVSFDGGVFSVLLGSTEPILTSVFDGGRRWLSVSIEEEAEILPRGELVSVGYAFFSGNADSAGHALTADYATDAETAEEAVNADKLDNLDSSKFSGVSHTHDSRYYRQDLLDTSDGTPPNQGSNLVHWNILTGLPDGFADGVDDTGEGPTDHGQLSGLLDNDHPQYALADSLKMTDGTPPNQGRNMVHWSVLRGVPEDFVDETDDITTDAGDIVTGTMAPERIDGVAVVSDDNRLLTAGQRIQLTGGGVTTLHAHDASQIVSGTMAPERIEGVAIVSTDDRLLTSADKAELTGGDTTALHVHIEAGDISAVTAGEGLTGGGTTDSVEVAHAEDASSLPLAHHTPPVLAYEKPEERFSTASASPTVVVSDSLVVPDSGFIFVSFSATQMLDVTVIPDPPYVVARRYIADYGVSVDTPSALQYKVRSSMLETEVWFAGLYVPTKAVAGSAVFKVTTPGKHMVYFLTEVAYAVDSGARSVLEDISLSAVFIEHDSSSLEGAMILSGGGQRSSSQAPVGR